MAILKKRDPDTSITFEMRRRPLNAFPDIPDEFDEDLMQSRHDGTLSRRVSTQLMISYTSLALHTYKKPQFLSFILIPVISRVTYFGEK